MRFFFLLLLVGAWWRPAAQAPTPPLTPEPAALVGTYRLTYQPDSTDPARRTDILYLLLGKTLSRFQSRGEQLIDSLLVRAAGMSLHEANSDLLWKQFLAMPHSQFHYSIYKTVALRRVCFYDRLGMQSYRYEEPTPPAWTLVPTTATVAGYACQRATTSYGGRQWEAWFTRAVPVSDGPYKFYGLPGLIVKVSDTRQHYVFELTQLTKPTTEHLITLPRKTPITTDRATFGRAMAAYNADPAGWAGANDGTVVTSTSGATPDQLRARARENARKRNNALELR